MPIGRVSQDRVARELVRLVEAPRRESFLGRLYDMAVAVNRHLPSLVDWGSVWWVRRKRRQALLATPQTAFQPALTPRLTRVGRAIAATAGPSAVSLVLAAGGAGLWLRRDRHGNGAQCV